MEVPLAMKVLKKDIVRRIFYMMMTSLCVLSCSNGVLLDEFRPVPNQSWNYAFTPEFKVNVKDNQIPYTLKVNLRLTSNYRYSDLFVLVHQRHAKQNEFTTKRVGLKVADKDGRWLGKGAGSLYSYQISYHANYHFSDTGTYYFKIEQNMRDNPLKGVSDVGICVLPANIIE